MGKTCHACHGDTNGYRMANLKRCAGCRKVYYCSTACQKRNWVEHIFDCKPHRPINTADYLALAVRQQHLPEHAQTCDDYGFNRAFPSGEKPMLLGLYTGLFEISGVSAKTVHDWRVRGVLVDEIKGVFHKLPEKSRGDFYRWFLRNEHVVALAGQPLPEQMFDDRSHAMFARAWRFVGNDERDSNEDIKAAIARKPQEEQHCHLLYAFLLSEEYPSPHLSLWVDFGYVSCTTHDDEVELTCWYILLIHECTFKEFCEAYRARRLLDLFDAKGFRQMKHRDHLRDLLHGSQVKKTVWYLKQSIVLEDCIKERIRIPQSVMVDYGFVNCRSDSERRQLMRVYKAFFDRHDGDPLALHEAAMKGNTHGYLSTVVEGLRDPKFERLMKNLY